VGTGAASITQEAVRPGRAAVIGSHAGVFEQGKLTAKAAVLFVLRSIS
jgi:hypothetical protein